MAMFDSKCMPPLEQCSKTGSDFDCMNASNLCFDNVESTTIGESSDFDAYDLRKGSNYTFPLTTFESYLQKPSIVKAIGANQKIQFQSCSDAVYSYFNTTGDRTSFPITNEDHDVASRYPSCAFHRGRAQQGPGQ